MAHENLYDSLSYKVPDMDISDADKDYLANNIPKLSTDKKELLYTLIIHDYIKSNPTTKVVFPYKIKQIDEDKLELKLDALPNKLKRILLKFVKLAMQSAKEEAEKTPLPGKLV